MSDSIDSEVGTATDPPMTAQRMRSLMPIAERIAYFDHSAVAPLPRPAADAISAWVQQAAECGDTVWLDWHAQTKQARQRAATLIGADEDEITLVHSTTDGINYVAEGIDWREGDNAVILADEYPSNVYPWLHQQDRGVETRLVPTDRGRPDLDKLRAACDSRTRIVSVSWVGYSTGYRIDPHVIGQIAHDAGALFLLDAIQGLGAFPLDVSQTPVDFVAADGHKWMLGPEGAGLTYIRREHLDKLRVNGVGATSMVNAYDYANIEYRLRPDAARYEGGAMNMAGMIGWNGSLGLLNAWRPEELAAAVLAITDEACERLQSIGAPIVTRREIEPNGHDPRSGIISFTLPGQDPMEVRSRCLDAGIALSSRSGRLRIAPHAYNNRTDLDRLIEALTAAS